MTTNTEIETTVVEAELKKTIERIAELHAALEKEKAWRLKLVTTLSVIRQVENRPDDPLTPVSTRHTPIVNLAEAVLIAMLRKKGDFIRQRDAVELLRKDHGIVVGKGIPGRETSDLSAYLGAGRSRYLCVTRRHGWGLAEWNGVPPCKDLLPNPRLVITPDPPSVAVID